MRARTVVGSESITGAATVRILLLALLAGCAGARPVIGETARVGVEGAVFLARVDTGAARTSVHAADIVVEGGGAEMAEDVGKTIRFVLTGEDGAARPMSAVIASVQRVRNSQGSELRYAVPLRISWKGLERTVEVNLRDRSAMDYKLLIGRDWLKGTALVDVGRAEP